MTSRIDKDWLKAYTMDAELRADPLVLVWAEVFASEVLSALHNQLDDLSKAHCPDLVPQEWLGKLAENLGALWSDAAGWANARQQVRHSLQVMRRAGSPRAVAVQFGLADLTVTVGEIWLDRLNEWPGSAGGSGSLVQLVHNDTLDDGGTIDDGGSLDTSIARRFPIPRAQAMEFSDQFWGKTTFVTLDVLVRLEAPGRQGLVDTLAEQWLPALLPVHCRLLGTQTFGGASEDLRQDVGYWSGDGYGYSYEYGYAYGSWTFHRLGAVGWAQDSGMATATLDDGTLDLGVWDDGGWWDLETPQWGAYLSMDEGSWDDPADLGIYDDV